jgi:hypothetical protein
MKTAANSFLRYMERGNGIPRKMGR